MKLIREPLLLIAAVIVILGMLRLGVWQLSRAEEKQQILDQQFSQASSTPVPIQSLIVQNKLDTDLRFKQVVIEGRYDEHRSIFIDNQVLDSKVGYLVFTPMQVAGTDFWVFVNRGWLPVGQSRATLPEIMTKQDSHTVYGRLNTAPARPPMLSEDFVLPQTPLWPYLSIKEAERKMNFSLLPLVVELAPEFEGEIEPSLQRRWREINDRWVATHKGYAFQWFAMALAFAIACIVLFIRSNRQDN